MTLIAPLKDTVSNYCYLPDSKVMIQKNDYRYTIIEEETFHHLYHALNDHKAALKEDCIEYVIYNHYKPLFDYPQWFMDAIDEGWIIADHGVFIFIDHNGETAMSDDSVILRNFIGDLRYMEREDFEKYYEEIGEE